MNILIIQESYEIMNLRLDIHYYLPILKGASLDNALFFCRFFVIYFTFSLQTKLTVTISGVD
jgi:hypothetical protein